MLQAEPADATEAPGLLTLHPDDDVAVALRPLARGERLAMEIGEPIPLGHKVALRALQAGAEVRKFGWPIGRLTASVAAGEHVHSHNLVTLLIGVEGYEYAPAPVAELPRDEAARFMGYRRPDGRSARATKSGSCRRSVASPVPPRGSQRSRMRATRERSTGFTPSATRMAARSWVTISTLRASCWPRWPVIPMRAGS